MYQIGPLDIENKTGEITAEQVDELVPNPPFSNCTNNQIYSLYTSRKSAYSFFLYIKRAGHCNLHHSLPLLLKLAPIIFQAYLVRKYFALHLQGNTIIQSLVLDISSYLYKLLLFL